MSIINLKFFNKKWHEITPMVQDGVFNLTVNLNQVSTGLFESEYIYILEEVFQRVNAIPILNEYKVDVKI